MLLENTRLLENCQIARDLRRGRAPRKGRATLGPMACAPWRSHHGGPALLWQPRHSAGPANAVPNGLEAPGPEKPFEAPGEKGDRGGAAEGLRREKENGH